jgi:2-dehydro-3-deoxyphosphogluconate aldolase/(4S)-4-hydroxy-2-oxoglutarate aldolase
VTGRPSRLNTLRTIAAARAIAVIRLKEAAHLRPVVEALAAGDVRVVEITMTMPGALEALAELRDHEVLVGAGSVLDSETARLVILAGARFVVAPTFCPRVVEMSHRYDVVAIPGALTPTEILTASEAGADLVKVFPAGRLGPAYLQDLRGPLPGVRMVATGGVTAENAAEFLAAGAFAVGVGGALVEQEAVARGDFQRITQQARRLRKAVIAGVEKAQ